MLKSISAASAVFAAAIVAGSALAQASPPAGGAAQAVDTDPCHAPPTPPQPAATDYAGGLSPVGSGLTPAKVPGATTVAPFEAACLYSRNRDTIVVLDATNDDQGLPGAYRAVFAAGGRSLADDVQRTFEAKLREVTGGDMNRPILIYCHHVQCFLSYNVTLRAVQAGYRNVYWMREGIAGWQQYRLPVQPVRFFSGMEPPSQAQLDARLAETQAAARELAMTRLRGQMADCDQSGRYQDGQDYGLHLVQNRTRAEADASFEAGMARQIDYEKMCFGNYRTDAQRAGLTELVTEIDAVIANAPARLRAAYQRGRVEFEKNPVEFMWDDHGKLPAKLRDLLKTASGPLNLQETCGAFDLSVPAINQAALAAFDQRYEARRQCANAWVEDRPNIQGKLGLGEIEFNTTITMLQGIRPYLCSAWNKPNCVPDARWNALAAVATPQNAARMKAAAERAGNRSEQLQREAERMRMAMDATNQAVRAYNASQ
jgi:PQQ-dependent catabolism-associated CXXCW motif protein